ncbi:unnamed protein product [Coccothraustes coccothraustes]
MPAEHPEPHPQQHRGCFPRVLHPQACLLRPPPHRWMQHSLKTPPGKHRGAWRGAGRLAGRAPVTAGLRVARGHSRPLPDGANPHPGSIRSIARTAPAVSPSRHRTASHRPH